MQIGQESSVAGIKNFTWHSLRHIFASRLVMAGVDIRTVQESMGHKTITMTLRYPHLAPSTNWRQYRSCARLCLHGRAQLTVASMRDGFRRDLLSTKAIRFLLLVPVAGMAKLADAADLKSAGPKGLWGFDSPSRHQLSFVF